jgi:hypothetical protein
MGKGVADLNTFGANLNAYHEGDCYMRKLGVPKI